MGEGDGARESLSEERWDLREYWVDNQVDRRDLRIDILELAEER
jgi:hypothetical protein